MSEQLKREFSGLYPLSLIDLEIKRQSKQIIIQFLQKVESTDDLVTLIVLLKQGSIDQLKAFIKKVEGGE